jgi:hypothetical protein
MKTFKRFIVLVCLPCMIYTQASAWKPINKYTGGNGGQGGSGSNAPIDGGIVILLVGGLLFGAKKIYDKNKKTKKDLTTV